MAQHDMNIANQGFPAFRADLNDALGALVSNSSGATAPSTTFAHQFWVDTAADPSVLKIRNADNDAWITIGEINQTDDKFKLTPADGIETDTISELTSAAGVTIDGVLLKDSAVGSASSPVSLNSLNYPTEGSINFRNRIINGDMRIDQRNAGAAVTAGNNTFGVDRFFAYATSPAVFTLQQDSSAPAGFVNSTKVTITTIDSSLGASDFNAFRHIIEGSNVADLGWGTANAKTITLSFWVRSSQTGTFTVGIRNSDVSRSYIAEYSISSADTWEYKTVTVTGDTTGTWLTGNTQGIRLDWDLGSGSDYQGTAGSWTATNDITTSGSVKLVGTLNATWYITGVQLEVGSVATPFERRPYGMELSLCQRYYETTYDIGVAPGSVTYLGVNTNGGFTSMSPANYATRGGSTFKVTKRAQPTITTYDSAGNSGKCNYPDTATNQSFTVIHRGFQAFTAETSTLSAGTDTRCYWHFVANAEL